jgi:hypothetical protein
MQRKSVSRMWMVATIVCGLMASGASAIAQSNAGHCSDRTLFGDYGAPAEGVLLPPAAPSETQFRSVGVAHFDGKGNFTGVEHTVVNGVSLEADWTANSGTYSVNSNCTGKLVLNTPNSPVPLNLFFVVVKHGSEFHTVLDSNAISATYIKVE